jgi:hypothetical protein
LLVALKEVGCVGAPGGAFEGRIDAATQPALRTLALACLAENAMLVLHAEHSRETQDPASYRRLWDRTDQHQAQIAAWRQGDAVLPTLEPGDLLRL